MFGKMQFWRTPETAKRACKIIIYSCYEHWSSHILNERGWETLDQRRTKQLAFSVYKTINNLFPTGLKSSFEPTSQIHSYNLRGSSNNIFIQRPQNDAQRRVVAIEVQFCGIACEMNLKLSRQLLCLKVLIRFLFHYHLIALIILWNLFIGLICWIN